MLNSLKSTAADQSPIKKTSGDISLAWHITLRKGSMTVEACVVLPLVLFFLLSLCSVMEMMRLHGKISFALWEIGNRLSVYACAEELLLEDSLAIPDLAVSYGYVNLQLQHKLSPEYLDASPLTGGAYGIQYPFCEYMGEDACVDISAVYHVSPKIGVFPGLGCILVNRYYARAWTGYDVSQAPCHYVYVTEHGEAWHSRVNCSALVVTIHSVLLEDIDGKRNRDRHRYSLCQYCGEETPGRYCYITPYGEKYHITPYCQGLKRRVSAILWEDKGAYRACAICNS